MDRRDFMKAGGALLVGATGLYGFRMLSPARTQAAGRSGLVGDGPIRRWGMVIDLGRCRRECTACLDACRRENNVAYHGDERWDVHWIRKVALQSEDPAQPGRDSVPLLCNHCDRPPCAQVCPVKATYKRADGIVIVDHHRCIGCRYCMIACPYNARFFNYKENEDWPNHDYPKRSHGVAEACNLCAHRLDQGQPPACVEACHAAGHGALQVGDLEDPASEVSRLLATFPAKRIREDLGTEPKVWYLGL
jgi:tetrathionate reductase subunit B